MTEKLTVKIENQFAQRAPYRLRTRSHALFYFYLSHIDPFSDKIEDVTIPIKDIEDYLKSIVQTGRTPKKPTHWGNFKEEVEPSIRELKSCTTLLPSAEGVQRNGRIVNDPVSIFSEIKSVYDNAGKASYKFTVDPRMRGFLFDIAQRYYVQFQLKEDVKLSNNYAWRLYIAFKSRAESQRKYTQYPFFDMTIPKLRKLLVLDNGSYTKSHDFKRYVIEKALVDINANSDMRCWPEYLTKGRTLTGVRFHLSISKYNRHQLKLSLNKKKDQSYKYLKALSKKRFNKVNLKEFIAHFPKQYQAIEEQVDNAFADFFKSVPQNEDKFDAKTVKGWKDGHIRSKILDFARNELLLFED